MAKRILLGCLGFLVLVVVGLYVLVMHTPVPFTLLAGLMSQSSMIDVGACHGSIASGPQVDSVTLYLPDDQRIELGDMALRYPSFWGLFGSDTLVLNQIKVGRASFQIHPDETERPKSPTRSDSPSVEKQTRDVRVDELTISDVSFEGVEFHLDHLKVLGLETHDGQATVDEVQLAGSGIDFNWQDSTEAPLFPEAESTAIVTFKVEPSALEGLLKPVAATFTYSHAPGQMAVRGSDIDGTLSLDARNDFCRWTFRNLSPADYVSEEALSHIYGVVEEEGGQISHSEGRFQLGRVQFTFEAGPGPMVGHHQAGQTLLHCKIGKGERKLWAEPPLDEESAASLLFAKTPTQLTAAERTLVDQTCAP
ncbi:MAG: hypothetical protein AB7S38_26085 [Vulcanimicrobiota bacterium]